MARGLLAAVVVVAVVAVGCEVRRDRPASGSGSALTYPGAVPGPPPPSEAPPATAATAAWKAGDAALVLWHGRWWRGRILAVRGPDRYRVHYDGWESSWDEEVPAARLAPIAVEAPP